MKKLIVLGMTAVLTFGLVACGSSKGADSAASVAESEVASEAVESSEAEDVASEEAPSQADLKVGVAAPEVTHGWVAGVAYYAEAYCKELGVQYQIATSSDAAGMTADLQDLMAWGADIIVSFPQWEGMETAFTEVVDAGIPVVNFDLDVNVDGVYMVTGDNYDMGYQCAKYITDIVGEAATIAVLDVPSSGSVCQLRKEGFYAYLDEINYDKTNIFESQEDAFTQEDGLKDMADLLERYSTIDAVFSMDDETSMGAIQAITEAGRTDIKAITGGGGCQAYFEMINDDKYTDLGLASALYSPAMIQDAIDNAIKLLNGETVEEVQIIPTTIVSKANVADYLDPENTVY